MLLDLYATCGGGASSTFMPPCNLWWCQPGWWRFAPKVGWSRLTGWLSLAWHGRRLFGLPPSSHHKLFEPNHPPSNHQHQCNHVRRGRERTAYHPYQGRCKCFIGWWGGGGGLLTVCGGRETDRGVRRDVLRLIGDGL